ncbi:MAG: GGDEF domain-containing protein [Clostridiales bacterium]|nr:GGDEF domain-containing protein [Clostridiales bacterium]
MSEAKRLNIGLLIDDLDNNFSAQACKGAEFAAKVLDANLFIFPGHYIGKSDARYQDKQYEYQYNSVFKLVNEKHIDILYILFGIICSRADVEQQEAFLKSLPKVPTVLLFTQYPGYASVMYDNHTGLGQAIRHLITKHDCRRIGFVSGPMTNQDARERLDVYKEVLELEGITYEDRHVTYGDFTEDCGDNVEELLKKDPELQAIVFANDVMAMGGYKKLKELGKVPGKDIMVTGFDDDIFSVSMNPPLTTVDASSADLTYKSVLNARKFIDGKKIEHMSIRTYLVQRSSCGCNGLDVESQRERLRLDCLETGSKRFIDECIKYLFGMFDDDDSVIRIKQTLSSFLEEYSEFLLSNADLDKKEAVDYAFDTILETNILSYTTPEKVFNLLQTLLYEGTLIIKEQSSQVLLNEMFADYYRHLSFAGVSLTRENLSKTERISRLINKQTGDIFLMSNTTEIPYDHLLDGLTSVGFRRSYIYLFQGNTKTSPNTEWKCPGAVLLKAINDEDGIRMLPEEQQLLRTEDMFANEFIPDYRRQTVVVFPLFVGEDMYGMLVTEMDSSNLTNVSPVSYQLAVTLKSLFMIDEQNKAKANLQSSLDQFMKDNTILDAMAKSDELTGLYNRRGFLDYAQTEIGKPENKGKRALICYADMDNLKYVNDKFGHDEGDFSLREIAAILNDAFRENDIIGRMGGDEFIVFAMIQITDYEKQIKDRIARITQKHNEEANKPYPIEMSIGICEFNCGNDIDIHEIIDRADEKLYKEKAEKKAKNGSYR